MIGQPIFSFIFSSVQAGIWQNYLTRENITVNFKIKSRPLNF